MGDEQHRLARLAGKIALAPDAQKLERHVVARSWRRARRTARPSAAAAGRAAARGRARRAAACRPTARAAACRRSRSSPAMSESCSARAARGAGVLAGQLGRQQHVLQDRAPFQQHRRLEDHADVGQWARARRGRRPSTRAGGGGPQAGHDAQQRGLAAAARAHQRDELARADRRARCRRAPRPGRSPPRMSCRPGRGRSVPRVHAASRIYFGISTLVRNSVE